MKPHTKIYLEKMGYDEHDFIPCEVCEAKAVDIHHIDARGMGGTATKDRIENLMAVCRPCHLKYGDIESLKPTLRIVHTYWMTLKGARP